jgi:hypothetical protein
MKLVLEILDDDGGIMAHRLLTAFPLTIGRAYHNDIILTDPHVGERHLTIDFDGQYWTLTDHGTVNPTLLNTRPVRGSIARLASGDTLRAGATTLRIFDPAHPVGEPVKIQKANPVFIHLTRPFNVWVYFALAALAVSGWTYATVWSEDPGLVLAGAAAATGVIALVWAALWSVAGRLIRRRSFFLAHLAMISLYLFFGAIVTFLSAAIDFLFSDNWPALAVGYLMNGALLALLVYGSLSLSTLMKKRRRLAAALFFAGGITCGVLGVGLAQSGKFNSEPGHPSRILLYLDRIAPAGHIDDFMANSARIFSADTFKAKKDVK